MVRIVHTKLRQYRIWDLCIIQSRFPRTKPCSDWLEVIFENMMGGFYLLLPPQVDSWSRSIFMKYSVYGDYWRSITKVLWLIDEESTLIVHLIFRMLEPMFYCLIVIARYIFIAVVVDWFGCWCTLIVRLVSS